MNFKSMYDDTTCTGCFKEQETTEHFLKCKKMQELTGNCIETNNFEEDINSTEWLIETAKHLKTLEEVRSYRLRY